VELDLLVRFGLAKKSIINKETPEKIGRKGRGRQAGRTSPNKRGVRVGRYLDMGASNRKRKGRKKGKGGGNA